MRSRTLHFVREALLSGLLLTFAVSCSDRDARRQLRDEYLDFLFAYMPLPDSVDYPRGFWEKHVDVSLKARDEMPWGKSVPEREWKHFVLPLRVNNENLDDSRTILYDSLKVRVRDMSMKNAILEVNHWCHEHVSYEPSDARTSAPLATMSSAIGRCGEESTFTVSALRAVGIPARQVYTPRWAHTDDNHAWVEAWADGKWYFLGACEPEPVLNLGWFNASASRGMLMHTRVFGKYEGSEEVIDANGRFTEINVTSNYADTATLTVRVVDAEGSPLPGARVEYKVYNYAEFYTLLSRQADDKGLSSVCCGLGDLLVWASREGRFGFTKASVGTTDTVQVVLDKDASYRGAFDLDIVPPAEKNTSPELTSSQINANRKRLAREDSIRAAYMAAAFFQSEDKSDPRVKARGNWHAIQQFTDGKAGTTPAGKALLLTLRDKDFRDVTPEVLEDHSTYATPGEGDVWQRYVLCPRVANEMLTPYRHSLSSKFRGMDAQGIVRWVKDSIRVDDGSNPQRLYMSPLGVYSHRVTDSRSRDVFFVASARSAGIPARIDEVSGKVQYMGADSTWIDANLSGDIAVQQSSPKGMICLAFPDAAVTEHPAYYSHFTLSRLDSGRLQLQEFPEGMLLEDGFRQGVEVDEGTYLLVSGTRMADGKVLAHLEFMPVQASRATNAPLRLRNEENELRVIGTFNCENWFTNCRGTHKTILKTTGRGYYLVGLIRSNHEPSIHVLREMEEANIYLSRWPHCFLMLFPSQEEYAQFRRQDYDGLPYNFVFGVADPETVKAMHIEELTHGSDELPILMIADTFNRVVWFSQGYTIGISERIMKAIRQLMKTDSV